MVDGAALVGLYVIIAAIFWRGWGHLTPIPTAAK